MGVFYRLPEVSQWRTAFLRGISPQGRAVSPGPRLDLDFQALEDANVAGELLDPQPHRRFAFAIAAHAVPFSDRPIEGLRGGGRNRDEGQEEKDPGGSVVGNRGSHRDRGSSRDDGGVGRRLTPPSERRGGRWPTRPPRPPVREPDRAAFRHSPGRSAGDPWQRSPPSVRRERRRGAGRPHKSQAVALGLIEGDHSSTPERPSFLDPIQPRRLRSRRIESVGPTRRPGRARSARNLANGLDNG
jgi:hypothetical protein